MLLTSAVCGPWQANCYLLALNTGQDCVIIDPGMDSAEAVRVMVERHRVNPVAVLATHGHLDHVADAAELADEFGVGLWIHPADRHLLTDPVAGLGADSAAFVAMAYPQGLAEPAVVATVNHGDQLTLAGLEILVSHAPGHTGGCVLYTVNRPDAEPLVFTGDVLFAGSIGRTDLPGGDPDVMQASLRGPVMELPHDAEILPGHGVRSTMARERATNPFLRFL